jgi:hypothetical protein
MDSIAVTCAFCLLPTYLRGQEGKAVSPDVTTKKRFIFKTPGEGNWEKRLAQTIAKSILEHERDKKVHLAGICRGSQPGTCYVSVAL